MIKIHCPHDYHQSPGGGALLILHTTLKIKIMRMNKRILFVCAGNTSRSPIAEAICNAELARRLNVAWEAMGQTHVRALSAGVTPRADAPMTPESHGVLRQLGVLFKPHQARGITEEMTRQSEVIYCMTQKLRQQVIELYPAVATKVHCLDPEGDIEDPSGKDEATYARCARRIQALVHARLNEAGILGTPPATTVQ